MDDSRAIPDERLVALADGELPADEAAALRARIAADPALAERFVLFVEAGELLAPAPDAQADAGQDRLAAAIRAADARDEAPRPRLAIVEGGRTAAPAAAPSPATRPATRWRVAAPALAASVALVVGGALGLAVGRSGAPAGAPGDVVAVMGAPAAANALASALEKTPSGETVAWADKATGLNGRIALISSHGLEGGVCREYEATAEGRAGTVAGLGCRGPDGRWRTEILARKSDPDGGYATASGASVVESALEAMGSPGALSAEDEAGRIRSGWAPPR